MRLRSSTYCGRMATTLALRCGLATCCSSGWATCLRSKSGASFNYFIEWIVAVVLLTSIAMVRLLDASSKKAGLACIILGALVVQTERPPVLSANRALELAPLAKHIAAADAPVISDEMVMVIRSGRDVIWESAIHAELAALGRWDPESFAQRIRAGEFGMIVTEGMPGSRVFQSRYPESITAAILGAYPQTLTYDRYTVHLKARAVTRGAE